MTNPIQRTVQASQASTETTLSYCFVRLKGGLLRTTSVKFFYLSDTKMVDFLERCKTFGEVKAIDFPEEQKEADYLEYLTALTENRVIY